MLYRYRSGKSCALLCGREDGVQLRFSYAQQWAYCGRCQAKPGGNGVVVVALVLQAQGGRIRFGEPVDGGAAVHVGKL